MQQKRKQQQQQNAQAKQGVPSSNSKKKQRLIDQRQKKARHNSYGLYNSHTASPLTPYNIQKSKQQFEGWRARSATVVTLPPAEQAEWLFQSHAELTKASALERGPLTGMLQPPPVSCGTHFSIHLHPTHTRTASTIRTLPNAPSLQSRIQQLIPNWKTALCDNPQDTTAPPGAPRMLLICASAVAANDMVKQLPALNARQRIGKLFAKHFKQAEQEAWLKKHQVSVASGTPHRLAVLIASGALSLARLEYIVLDVSLDAKQRTILDQPETCRDFWALYDAALKGVLGGEEDRKGAVLVLCSCKASDAL